MKRPNILYIHSHDTGRCVQPYGYPVSTPAIQQLAGEGVLFRHAFCANPTCSPSRASLLTGCWPHQNGMIGLLHRGARLQDPKQCLPWTLKSAGYHTAVIGIQHIAEEESEIGYEEVDRTYDDEQMTANAIDFLRRPHGQPFFLSVGFFRIHRFPEGTPPHGHNDFAVSDQDARYTRPPPPLPDTPETRRDFADFAIAASQLDRNIGSILEALNASGLAENTLVICTTDHGIAFPGMKASLSDHGIGVHLTLRGPGGFVGGQASDALVMQLDLYPTICEVAGIAPPDWLQGRSLCPLVRGEVEGLHNAVFAQMNYHATFEPMRAVRTERYKYIRRFAPGSHSAPNTDPSMSKDLWLEHGWSKREPAEEQLYDLIFDPCEADNLVIGNRDPGVLADMRQRLEVWMRDTGDPLADPAGLEKLEGLDYRRNT